MLANLTLDGMESAIRAAIDPKHDKVNFIRYADDFCGDRREQGNPGAESQTSRR